MYRPRQGQNKDRHFAMPIWVFEIKLFKGFSNITLKVTGSIFLEQTDRHREIQEQHSTTAASWKIMQGHQCQTYAHACKLDTQAAFVPAGDELQKLGSNITSVSASYQQPAASSPSLSLRPSSQSWSSLLVSSPVQRSYGCWWTQRRGSTP